VPDDQLTRDTSTTCASAPASPRATPRPPGQRGSRDRDAGPAERCGNRPARVDLYFNSPLTLGEVELLLDGQPLARRRSTTPSALSRRQAQGDRIVTTVLGAGGRHDLAVRLRGEGGRLLGEQVFRGRFAAEQRLSLRIEMDGEQARRASR